MEFQNRGKDFKIFPSDFPEEGYPGEGMVNHWEAGDLDNTNNRESAGNKPDKTGEQFQEGDLREGE
ncbi:MAG: hypothetical protein M1383_02400 [Patescibacteria group bacterium]|nr:hypothetical protein [Patescibacteria group bacterium]